MKGEETKPTDMGSFEVQRKHHHRGKLSFNSPLHLLAHTEFQYAAFLHFYCLVEM